MLEITYQCNVNLSSMVELSCSRSILGMIICVLIIAFSIYCIWKIYEPVKKITFETIPLLSTLFQALLQLILTTFTQDIRILIIALYF